MILAETNCHVVASITHPLESLGFGTEVTIDLTGEDVGTSISNSHLLVVPSGSQERAISIPLDRDGSLSGGLDGVGCFTLLHVPNLDG